LQARATDTVWHGPPHVGRSASHVPPAPHRSARPPLSHCRCPQCAQALLNIASCLARNALGPWSVALDVAIALQVGIRQGKE
jgi:hypothetical protein